VAARATDPPSRRTRSRGPRGVVDRIHLLFRRRDLSGRYAYRMQSSRVIPHERTGAITSRSGASARVDTSKRTWSLPFPVQPWPPASAPCSRAALTRCLAMIGRDSADRAGAPLVSRVCLERGTRKSRRNSSRTSVTMHSTARPAAALGDRLRFDRPAVLSHVDRARAMTSTPRLFDHPANGHRRVEPTAGRRGLPLCHRQPSLLALIEPRIGVWPAQFRD